MIGADHGGEDRNEPLSDTNPVLLRLDLVGSGGATRAGVQEDQIEIGVVGEFVTAELTHAQHKERPLHLPLCTEHNPDDFPKGDTDEDDGQRRQLFQRFLKRPRLGQIPDGNAQEFLVLVATQQVLEVGQREREREKLSNPSAEVHGNPGASSPSRIYRNQYPKYSVNSCGWVRESTCLISSSTL